MSARLLIGILRPLNRAMQNPNTLLVKCIITDRESARIIQKLNNGIGSPQSRAMLMRSTCLAVCIMTG